jgi:hypothetical protein
MYPWVQQMGRGGLTFQGPTLVGAQNLTPAQARAQLDAAAETIGENEWINLLVNHNNGQYAHLSQFFATFNYGYGPAWEVQVELVNWQGVAIPNNMGLGNTVFRQTGGDVVLRYGVYERNNGVGGSGSGVGVSGVENLCICDAVLECLRADGRRYQTLTLERLVSAFQDDPTLEDTDLATTGITIAQLERMLCKFFPEVSLYCFGPAGTVLWSMRAPDPRINLTLFVNETNNHATLVRDRLICSRAARTPLDGKLNLETDAYNWRNLYTYAPFMDRIDTDAYSGDEKDLDTLASLLCAPLPESESLDSHPGFLLFSPTNQEVNSFALVAAVTRATGEYVTQFDHYAPRGPTNGEIRAFVVPTTRRVVLLSRDHASVSSVIDFVGSGNSACTDLQLPLQLTRYSGQSMAKLGADLLHHMVGTWPSSRFNDRTAELFATQKGGACAQVFEPTEIDDVCLDITRCYSSLISDPPAPFSIFGPFDDPIPLASDQGLKDAEWGILRDHNCIRPLPYAPSFVVTRQLLPGFYINFLVQEGVLDVTDITHVLRPQSYLPKDTFKTAVASLHSLFTSEEAKEAGVMNKDKLLVNFFVGCQGVTRAVDTHTYLTDSADYVAKVHGRALAAGRLPVVCQETGLRGDPLYVVQEMTQTTKLRSNVPIYQAIVHAGTVRVLKLIKECVSVGFTAIGMETDAAYFRLAGSPVETSPLGHDVIPTLVKNMGGDPGQVRPALSRHRPVPLTDYKETAKEYFDATAPALDPSATAVQRLDAEGFVDTEENITVNSVELKTHGCLVTGGPGHGKSTLLARLYGIFSKALVLTPTGAARDSLPSELEARTVDFVLTQQQSQWRASKYLTSFEAVLVDEYSQLNQDHYWMLYQAKRLKPSLVFYLFGDADQLAPYEGESPTTWQYDVAGSYLAGKYLCDGRRIDMPYVEGCSRYDRRLRITVDAMRQHGVLRNPTFGIDLSLRTNIVVSNAEKRRIDKRHMTANAALQRQAGETVFVWPYHGQVRSTQTIQMCPGLLVIFRRNCESLCKQRISNSDRFVVTSATADSCVLARQTVAGDPSQERLDEMRRNGDLREDLEGEEITVTRECFLANAEPNYAITAQRMQSQTIEGPYNIWRPWGFSKRALYVALSRGRKSEHVRLQRFHQWLNCTWDEVPLRKHDNPSKTLFAGGSVFVLSSPLEHGVRDYDDSLGLAGFLYCCSHPPDLDECDREIAIWKAVSSLIQDKMKPAMERGDPWAEWMGGVVAEGEVQGLSTDDLKLLFRLEILNGACTRHGRPSSVEMSYVSEARRLQRDPSPYTKIHLGGVRKQLGSLTGTYDPKAIPVPKIIVRSPRHLPNCTFSVRKRKGPPHIYMYVGYYSMASDDGRWTKHKGRTWNVTLLARTRTGNAKTVIKDMIMDCFSEHYGSKSFCITEETKKDCVERNWKKYLTYLPA